MILLGHFQFLCIPGILVQDNQCISAVFDRACKLQNCKIVHIKSYVCSIKLDFINSRFTLCI
jgi:hypothetical protein